MRKLSMTPHAIKMRERRKKMKVEGIESQPRHDCLCTLREIAEYWGVSTARAGQIERMALDKMREGLADVGLCSPDNVHSRRLGSKWLQHLYRHSRVYTWLSVYELRSFVVVAVDSITIDNQTPTKSFEVIKGPSLE